MEEDETNNNNTEEKKATNIKEFYCIKPIPDTNCTPILVFLNPKSGGNQGVKLMQKFQWLLNPRQVFDLTKGGPGPAIDLFRLEDNTKYTEEVVSLIVSRSLPSFCYGGRMEI